MWVTGLRLATRRQSGRQAVTPVICRLKLLVLQSGQMQAPTKCPGCGLDLGRYVETHCPQCGVSLAPKPPMTPGLRLLELTIEVCGALFVLGSLFGFAFYMKMSSRAELYEGAPYHATGFRVTSVEYYRVHVPGDGENGGHYETYATAIGIVEGQKESMDLLPYLNAIPRDRYQLMDWVPEGTVIPVDLFPTLRGQNRIQPIREEPTEEWYRRRATWASKRALPVTGLIGMVAVLLGLVRFSLWRSAQRRLAEADCFSR